MCDMGAGMEVCRGVDVDKEMSDRGAMYHVDAGVAAGEGRIMSMGRQVI